MAIPKKKDFALVVWMFGWLATLVATIRKVAIRLVVPFEAFEILGLETGEYLVESIVRLIGERHRAQLEADTGELRPDEYRVFVNYLEPAYSFEVLSKLFDNVSDFFMTAVWKPIASTFFLDQTSRHLIFRLWNPERRVGSEEAIAINDREGYRPATFFEAIFFAIANLDLQRISCIVILGSSALRDDHSYVALLTGDSSMRTLGRSWFVHDFRSDDRFLFVRKESFSVF